MNCNRNKKDSSGRTGEDARGNTCGQTVQQSVETNTNARAASPGETEQIAGTNAEPPSAVFTDFINPAAAAEATASAEADNNNSNSITIMSENNDIPTVPADDESAATQMNNATAADVESATGSSSNNNTAAAPASANLNSGTDCASTSDKTMNINTNNHDGIALTGNDSTTRTVIRTEIAAADTPLCERDTNKESFEIGSDSDESKAIRFTIKNGGAMVVARVTIDDEGALVIKNSNGDTVISLPGRVDVWQKTQDPTHWQNSSDPIFLPAGEYSITGSVTNKPLSTSKNNLAYFRYEVQAQYTVIKGVDDEDEDKEQEPPICNICGCGTDSGSNTGNGKDNVPGSSDDECTGSVSPTSSPDGGSNGGGAAPAALSLADEAESENASSTFMRYDSVRHWRAQVQDGVLTIYPTSGRRMTFDLVPGDSVARPAALTRHHAVRVELQNADLSPCTSGVPAFMTLTEASGQRVRFDAQGAVSAVISASGRVTTAAEHAAQVQERFADDGSLLSVYSPTQGLMLCSDGVNGEKILSWYTPAQVAVDADGNYSTSGEPYKTSTHLTTVINGVETTTVTRQQAGLPAHTETRMDDGSTVTVIKGTGEEAIIHTWENTYPEVGLLQIVETLRKGSADAVPASCSCEQRKLTAGGWLTVSRTEGYGTELARTTTYDYNEQFLVSCINRPDGGYTEYTYDADGRVTQEISPWGNGGKMRTRYVYNANSARFYDNRPVKVYTDYQEANSGSWLNIKVVDYTYEHSATVERTTATTYAAGVNHQQVTIEERYGEAPEYSYSAGKPKFSQAVNGVQTWHDYEATTEHGAVHKHTVTTKANGELVAAQSRKTEEFIAADGTTSFEQESIWDGENWLLLSTNAFEYDEQKRVVRTTRGNGRSSSTTWMCCGRLSETDEDGITTTYGYNSAHQLIETIRAEVKDGDVIVTPETITTYTHDAAGRTLTTRRDIGAMTTTESSVYDALGRVISQTDILGRVTTTTYSTDGLTTTTTTPAGATTITQRNLDGSTARISGTAQREVQYSYTRNGNNLVTTTALADGSVLSQNITNGFEQAIVQTQPNTQGGFICSRSEYNAKGQLVKQYQDTGWNTDKTAPTLYEYDSFGKQVKQVLALVDTPTKDNSPMSEVAYSVESAEDGVYSVATHTRYNAAGEPLSATQKQLISQLSATLARKSISSDVRGNSSASWTEYTAPTKVTNFNSIPTSEITAEAISVDGFTISQKDHVGIVTTATRSYTASGMTLTQIDGRGNATTSTMDLVGRTISVTDAVGALTTTVYDIAHDQPSVVTDAMGNTYCYKYDPRGRKIAEWGTALQPVCFGYDEADNLISLKTFRAGTEIISSDTSERMDGDETTWAFDPVTGLELRKTYADNSSEEKTYDRFNRLATETDARGIAKTHSYEIARGLQLNTTYSDGTTARQYAYNHLGQLTQVTDDAGIRSIGYNAYGEQETDTLLADEVTHLITETRDAMGRSTGFNYAKNGMLQHAVTTGYGTDGRIATAGFLHGSDEKQFGYGYLPGSNLLQTLTMPCNMTLTQSYESQRDLLIGMSYHRSNTLVTQRSYTYDTLGRPLTRSTARNGQTVNDSFVHNSRSELASAQVNGETYGYNYDNIGNRRVAMEASDYSLYEANALNQYTSIQGIEAAAFAPHFDGDGNQTRLKTETGIWDVIYNAENRPVSFTNNESNTVVECAYDFMGRRCFKKVMVDGTVTLHQRYIYRGYLQIACCDLTRSNHPSLWYITWNPIPSKATRPLAIQKDNTWFVYGWDLTKNICEVYGSSGYIRTSYTYSPYGDVRQNGNFSQPIQWSSEFNDAELGLIYYNYRHYNPVIGKWTTRDFVEGVNLYNYVHNRTISSIDYIGLSLLQEIGDTLNTTWNSVKNYYNELDAEYNISARAIGSVQLIGGISEMSIGAAGVVVPEPATTVAGVVLVAHGVDLTYTALQTLLTGHIQETATAEMIQTSVMSMGGSKNTAAMVSSAAEMGIGIGGWLKASQCYTKIPQTRVNITINNKPHSVDSRVAERYKNLIDNDYGYNVSAEHVFTKYSHIGTQYTYITDYETIHAIIGNKCNLSQPLRTTFFSSNSSISYIDAFRLSRALGTDRFIYMRGIRVTRFSNLKNKGMTLPTEGNKYFKGYGNGLPTGGPEVIIPAQPTRPWSSHQ